MVKAAIPIYLICILLIEQLLFYGAIVYDLPFSVKFFSYLLPIITIGVTCVLLKKIILFNVIFFPLHCWTIGSIMGLSLTFKDAASFLFFNSVLLFIVEGYTICLRYSIDNKKNITIKGRFATVLPLATRVVLLCLTITIVLLVLFPHIRYSLISNPAFHCVAFVACPTIYLIAFFVCIWPPSVHSAENNGANGQTSV